MNRNNKIWRLSLLVVFVMGMLITTVKPIEAATSLSTLQKTKEYYAQLAEQARQAALQKQKEAAQISQQITIVTDQISQAQNAIVSTAAQIDQVESSIETLKAQIADAEANLLAEQEKFGNVVSSWYMQGQSGLLEAVITANSLSDVVNNQQYYDSVRQQLEIEMDKINQLKSDLAQQKSDQEIKLQGLNTLKEDQVAQQKNLEYNKNLKNNLLNNTTTAISDLNAQEQRANQRIAEINTQIKALSSRSYWGDQIVSSNDSSWYYTQTGNYTHLGSSPYTVSQYGCLVTSFAMVATYYGHHVTPSDIASNTGIFSRDGYLLVSTPPGIGIYTSYVSSINWAVVNDELANNHPVIVSIYLPSVGAVNSDGSSHFVVIKGRSGNRYLMHDPIGDGRGYDLSQVRSMKIIRPY